MSQEIPPKDANNVHYKPGTSLEFLKCDSPGGTPLTGVGKNEIIATNRPRHPWIPAYAGMTEWAR